MVEIGSHILVVDDDEGLRLLLRDYLSSHGYSVTVAESALFARHAMGLFSFDLVILDVMMPEVSGIEFASQLRGSGIDVAILMLTAKGEGVDRILGLRSGADDYLPKPFEPEELLLRVQAILRRSLVVVGDDLEMSEVLFGGYVYDVGGKVLRDSEGSNLYLTGGELDLLDVLAVRCNVAVSREDIMRLSGVGDGFDNLRAIDVQMVRLRRKLEADPSRPEYLVTVRNCGYLLRGEGRSSA